MLIPPSSNWIRFLRNYGPLPTNRNLFDEHVNAAIRRAHVKPIALPTPLIDDMVSALMNSTARSLLIAGTAGDGKTYHARKLWIRLGGDEVQWDRPIKDQCLTLPNGRTLWFIKDLSELSSDDGRRILAGLEKSVFDLDSETGYVIACNHGQILARLRKFVSPVDGQSSRLLSEVQSAFLDGGTQIAGLRVFDLGKQGLKHSFRSVVEAVVEHEEWGRCAGCELNRDDRRCAILINRERARGTEDGGRFASRLEHLIELTRLNDAHLPVRDLLALVANLLLGHPDAKEGLMTCDDVARIQNERNSDRASIYRNVFGSNLGPRRAMARAVFRMLSSFRIGEETTNTIDGMLVYGRHDTKLADDFDALVANDTAYGANEGFLACQAQYLEGDESAREAETALPFLLRLRDQRQRLFFTLPDDGSRPYPFWDLSILRFAGDYLALHRAAEGNSPLPSGLKATMVRGLNRITTGLLLDNTHSVFIASSGGSSLSKVSVLCDMEIPAQRRGASPGLSVRFDVGTQRPCLDIWVGSDVSTSVKFDLTPVRFEFLCRVAEGALPGSFSNECYEDLLAYKVRLLRKAEHVRASELVQAPDENNDGGLDLVLSFIEIAPNGSGFLKPMIVGGDQ
ncbi:hypothetical protein R75465_06723 [Paraburkholderia aspalathi]|uniref:hypothetical protein n=1 Tax=Paraburkholderia aspalathi TaxID=1324617 RepID=UPI001B1942FB|nr:hypothetical protein [Paraburkholderia aspalathi]CAE6841161.1 hypothetical protein R75465_06723 [Paraburkholderia aspalathi]